MRYATNYTHILGDEYSPYEILILLGKKGYTYIRNCQKEMLEKKEQLEKTRKVIMDLEKII